MGDKVPWMPEMFLYRTMMTTQPRICTVEYRFNLSGIFLSDSSVASTGARVKQGHEASE